MAPISSTSSANVSLIRLTKEDAAAHGSGRGRQSHDEGDEPFQPIVVVIWIFNFSYDCESPQQSSSL